MLMVGANLALLFIYAVGISRVIKGVHTYNQIVSGIVQGSLLALAQTLFYEELFTFYLDLRYMNFFELIFNEVTMVLNILAGIGCYVHYKTLNEYVLPEEYKTNIIRHCG
jgi:hypothetical protein